MPLEEEGEGASGLYRRVKRQILNQFVLGGLNFFSTRSESTLTFSKSTSRPLLFEGLQVFEKLTGKTFKQLTQKNKNKIKLSI